MTGSPAEQRTTCDGCSVALGSRAGFLLRARRGFALKCRSCSLVDRTLLLRSLRVALVVGSLLVALNQGDALLSGDFPWAAAWWKLPLTYLVPFCVATYGALSNGYRPASAAAELA